MKFTIVPDDKSVGVDGAFLSPIDLSQLDSTIHAVQWYGTYGEIEYKTRLQNGRIVKPENTVITDATPYQFAVAAWNAKKAEIEAANQMPVTEL